MNNSLFKEFLEQSVYRMELNYPRIQKCLEELSVEEIWMRPNGSSNSTGNLILHLCGNITQYIISVLGGKKDNRNRNTEFELVDGFGKDQLLEMIKEVSQNASSVINGLNEYDLTGNYEVQGFTLSGTAIIVHVVEHYSYHTGQIVFLTKMLKDIDTGFYKGMDLNTKNNQVK